MLKLIVAVLLLLFAQVGLAIIPTLDSYLESSDYRVSPEITAWNGNGWPKLVIDGIQYRFRSQSAVHLITLIQLKASKVTRSEIKRIQRRQLAEIDNLYSSSLHPKYGAIGSIEDCIDQLTAQRVDFSLHRKKLTMIIGGTDSRFRFGECTSENTTYVGSLFQVFDSDQKIMLRLQTFLPQSHNSDIEKTKERLKLISQSLLLFRGK